MYIVRLLILSFLILAIVIAYTPQARVFASVAWIHARPGVIALMDNMYATFRNFVVGNDPHNGIHDNAPGVNFDLIITGAGGRFL